MRLERYRPTPMGTIIIINLVGLWAMFHVWTRHTAIELGYAISKTQREYEELVTDNSALKLEISTLKSTRRLEMIASSQLGLTQPTANQVVYLWKPE